MFSMSMSTLPDLTPSDPHSLWYTSRHAPAPIPNALLHPSAAAHHDHQHHHHHLQHYHHHSTHAGLGGAAPTNPLHPRDRDHRRALVERTALARLRHDEALMDRRRANVSNYGSWWLKPPGVPKTLFQMREERRELDEQAEAARREAQLQAQLSQAGFLNGEDEQMMEEEDGAEGQDLDDEIPEAEGFGFDGEDSGEDEDERDEGEDEQETEEVEPDEEETIDGVDSGDHAGAVLLETPAQEIRDLRAAEDRVREMIARRQEEFDASEVFPTAAAGDGQAEQMLEEDDLEPGPDDAPDMNADISLAMDMDMDADLDEGIPEGGEGEYEHTDSDEDLGDDLTQDISFVGRSSGSLRPPHNRRLRRSMPRSSMRSSNRASLIANDMDISGLLSGDGSSLIEGSPHLRRRPGRDGL
ncbi:Apc15p protein-domain-containing protein [Coniella lustricola]|uniref:Apc15p protein-domain-containing protein n=1 Tax=Coniella lustricola TaxID=2025994 RepID=A0A2T3A3J2_9PEZI|nr:Apc15p protein-domain-containing protein [Coniella lustricola]